MPRDYKHRHQSRERSAPRGGSPWRWMAGGFVLGLAVAVAAYVEGRYPGTILPAEGALIPVPAAAAIAEVLAPEPEPAYKPRFEFYDLLPQARVRVSDTPEPARRSAREIASERAAAAREQPASPAAPATATLAPGGAPVREVSQPAAPAAGAVEAGSRPRDVDGYMLQVGSFRDLADADRLRAELTLNGYDALIQTVSVNGRDTWHRVRLGPYGDLRSAEQARAALAREQHRSMLMRVRG